MADPAGNKFDPAKKTTPAEQKDPAKTKQTRLKKLTWLKQKPRPGGKNKKHDPRVPKGEEPSYTRLNDTVRRFLDLKLMDGNFDARRDDKTAQGAAVKEKGDGKRRSRVRKQGDSQWLSEGQCSKGDSWSLQHDENKKGTGKGSIPTRYLFSEI